MGCMQDEAKNSSFSPTHYRSSGPQHRQCGFAPGLVRGGRGHASMESLLHWVAGRAVARGVHGAAWALARQDADGGRGGAERPLGMGRTMRSLAIGRTTWSLGWD